MSELPTLVIGALSERSTTMARGMRAAGRVGVQKTVVVTNAVVLLVLGGTLVFRALDLLVHTACSPGRRFRYVIGVGR